MRLIEFASAEEQLALWKLVSDSVWSAIADQAQIEAAEKQRQAEERFINKTKGKPAGVKPKIKYTSPPPPLPQPKPLYPDKNTSSDGVLKTQSQDD